MNEVTSTLHTPCKLNRGLRHHTLCKVHPPHTTYTMQITTMQTTLTMHTAHTMQTISVPRILQTLYRLQQIFSEIWVAADLAEFFSAVSRDCTRHAIRGRECLFGSLGSRLDRFSQVHPLAFHALCWIDGPIRLSCDLRMGRSGPLPSALSVPHVVGFSRGEGCPILGTSSCGAAHPFAPPCQATTALYYRGSPIAARHLCMILFCLSLTTRRLLS